MRLALLDVAPAGRALFWTSVMSDAPYERDDRTDHEALTVEGGVKYAARCRDPNPALCALPPAPTLSSLLAGQLLAAHVPLPRALHARLRQHRLRGQLVLTDECRVEAGGVCSRPRYTLLQMRCA